MNLVPKSVIVAQVNEQYEKFRHFESEFVSMVDAAMNFAKSNRTPEQKVKGFRGMATRIEEMIGPATACTSGCSHCCKMAVTISQTEAGMIAKELGITAFPVQGVSHEEGAQDAEVAKYMGLPCMFLKNSKCSIYDHRPIPCRLYHNLTRMPDLCDTKKYPGQETVALDTRWLSMAIVLALGPNEVYDDIRQFFPQGAINVGGL